MTTIIEGKATVSFDGEHGNAFYNPVQEFNRDLSILVLRHFIDDNNESGKVKDTAIVQSAGSSAECSDNDSIAPKRAKLESQSDGVRDGIRVLEALSASGLRAIRYAKEVEGIGEVVANDFSDAAVECIKQNVEKNDVQDLVKASRNDAITVMHEHKQLNKRFHVVDLDPYGSPAHFLDSAVQAVKDNGILMVTCTDMATLCGNTPESCFAKYGSMSLRSKCCHEIALRILLHSIETHANRYARYIEPLLAVHVDFYIRVFVRLHSGAAKAKDSCCKKGLLYQCCECESLTIQPLARKSVTQKGGTKYQNAFAPVVPAKCDICSGKFHIAGPIWTDPIYNVDFVKGMLERIHACEEDEKLGTNLRIQGMLSVVLEELPNVPLFYSISRLASLVQAPAPSSKVFRSALLNAGYKVSSSHTDPQGIKTNAPVCIIWDIMRCWAKKAGVNLGQLRTGSISLNLLNTEPAIIADFSIHPLADPPSRKGGILRYQPKIHKNWGPKSKAKGSISSINAAYFCQSNQNGRTDKQITEILCDDKEHDA